MSMPMGVPLMSLASSGACPSDTALIKDGEGCRSCMYYDTASPPVPTICYGQNLQNSYAPHAIESVGGSYSSVMAGSGCLNDSQCTTLMQQDLERARHC